MANARRRERCWGPPRAAKLQLSRRQVCLVLAACLRFRPLLFSDVVLLARADTLCALLIKRPLRAFLTGGYFSCDLHGCGSLGSVKVTSAETTEPC